jgi:hypothetical protein
MKNREGISLSYPRNKKPELKELPVYHYQVRNVSPYYLLFRKSTEAVKHYLQQE